MYGESFEILPHSMNTVIKLWWATVNGMCGDIQHTWSHLICKHQGTTMKLVFITHLLLLPSTIIGPGSVFSPHLMKTENHMIKRELRKLRLNEVEWSPQGPAAIWGEFSLLIKMFYAWFSKSHLINTQFNAKSDCKDMGNQNWVFLGV